MQRTGEGAVGFRTTEARTDQGTGRRRWVLNACRISVAIDNYVRRSTLTTPTRHRCRFLDMCFNFPRNFPRSLHSFHDTVLSLAPHTSRTIHSSAILRQWVTLYGTACNGVAAPLYCHFRFLIKTSRGIWPVRRPNSLFVFASGQTSLMTQI